MRLLTFTGISLAVAFGIEWAIGSIPYLGLSWEHYLHKYFFVLILLVPASVIAALAGAVGLWRGSDATKVYALIVCIVAPPIALGLFVIFALFVLRAPML